MNGQVIPRCFESMPHFVNRSGRKLRLLRFSATYDIGCYQRLRDLENVLTRATVEHPLCRSYKPAAIEFQHVLVFVSPYTDRRREGFDLSTFRSEREYFIDHSKTIVIA
ncbi:hypothetical protein TNCV_362501 [Trichonephila clavipes]|nr:hypothetical protein TNCV_362501 [Trichonephila clavipes]